MLTYWIWFSLVPGLNGRQKLDLLQHFRTPQDIYLLNKNAIRGLGEISEHAMAGLLNKDLTYARSIVKTCAEKGMGVLAFFDTGFPARLRDIDDPPMVLYYYGHLPTWEQQPLIGVVGTRKASSYGMRSAELLSAQIAACGGIVVSGGALGIDTMALQGAVEQDCSAVVVQAGGLDKLYPRANEALFEKILKKGCIFSEYPPGTQPYKGNFLHRNRLISGMSHAVLVVEAPRVSGALNTARWAWSQGREVFAVPGNIDVESCAGSNDLIGDIASAAVNGWVIMKEYAAMYPDTVAQRQPVLPVERSTPQKVAQEPKKPTIRAASDKISIDKGKESPYSVKENVLCDLTEQEKAVVALLSGAPTPLDQVVEKLNMPSGAVLTIITKLSVKGVVKHHPGKLISLN